MTWLEALILGIVQGLTEFLPISSSGHIELGKAIFGLHSKESISFTIIVHLATVFSIITVYWQDIWQLIREFFKFNKTEEFHYTIKLIVSAIPVAILGFTVGDYIENLFTGKSLLVSIFLAITGILLIITHKTKEKQAQITYGRSLIIGIAQAIAVLPGISRSGATISTSLLLGVNRQQATRFSFLMVIIPIMGIVFKNFIDNYSQLTLQAQLMPNLIGFVVAYVFGVIACKWMIKIVRNSKLIYFGIYCLLIATIGIIFSII